jgi:hypothetical protein
MPSLSQLTPDRVRLVVPFGAFSLKVSYRPDAVTPRLQRQVAAASREQDLDAGLLVPFCKIVDAWDLTDDDGSLVPIEPDALEDVPARVLMAVLLAIGEDMAPNLPSGSASNNGSSPTAGSEPLQTGTPG